MRVRLRFFATLRERAGSAELLRELSSATTVGELWEALRRERTALGEFRGSVAFAVNEEYVDSKTTLQDNDEVAFIPPVSGGSPGCLKSSTSRSISIA
jgi:molybdopterin converting factor subunit 1